jgi:hypothetical protein
MRNREIVVRVVRDTPLSKREIDPARHARRVVRRRGDALRSPRPGWAR